MTVTQTDHELVPEALIDKDGVKVSKSPWGPDDEIGRLNWITPDTNRAILEHLGGGQSADHAHVDSLVRGGIQEGLKIEKLDRIRTLRAPLVTAEWRESSGKISRERMDGR